MEHFRSSFPSTSYPSHFLPVYIHICLSLQLVAQKRNLAARPSGPSANADSTVCTVYLVPIFFFPSRLVLSMFCVYFVLFLSLPDVSCLTALADPQSAEEVGGVGGQLDYEVELSPFTFL